MSPAEWHFIRIVGCTLVATAVVLLMGFAAQRWAREHKARIRASREWEWSEQVVADIQAKYGSMEFGRRWEPQDWRFFDTVKPAQPETPPEDLGAT